MRFRGFTITLLVVAAALVAGWARAAPQAGAASAATYVGSETCATCHDKEAAKLAETSHGRAGFAAKSPHGCETCHGPGSLHVDDPDIKANQPTLAGKSAQELSAICTTCHTSGAQQYWAGSRHETRGLACTDCHSVHNFKSDNAQLKAVSAMDQCFNCHKDVRAETFKNSHHPIREGKISCADCHNPHGTVTAKLIKASSVNEQCYTCHTEKRGPFLWEHPPVRENCLNCHTPHGSNHIKLQRTTVPFICQQCHSNTRHPGTLYDGLRAPTLENEGPNPLASNRLFNRACLDCHAAIHGSNHPSSPYLAH